MIFLKIRDINFIDYIIKSYDNIQNGTKKLYVFQPEEHIILEAQDMLSIPILRKSTIITHD